jgi:hypothetical protein
MKEKDFIKEKLFKQIKYYIKKYQLCYIPYTGINDLHNINKNSPTYKMFIHNINELLSKIKTFPLSDLIFLKNQIKNDALKNKTKTNKSNSFT